MADPKTPVDDTVRTMVPETTRPSAQKLEAFRTTKARFELGKEIGRGGMGKVLVARDTSLRRGVAIKKVLATDEHSLTRFEREIRITAQLEHPSIVPIHDLGLDDEGRPFYVMRQIEGEPLASRIASLSSLRARLALLPNLLAVADAAAFAHARHIIHRDIKPANILLGSYGETLLIDWGLARRLDEVDPLPDPASSLPGEALTVTGHVYGTTGYMAPEQARGESVDARADVFAIGATLFHVLVGAGPYEGMAAAARIEAAALEEPAPLERLPLDTPPELRAIVAKAMAVDDRRYQHAGELAADLRAYLEGQLVGAHDYTVGERIRRFIRRHRFAVIAAAVSLVAIVAISVVAITRVVRAKHDADTALLDTIEGAELAQLERASALATTNPTRAAAILLHIPSGSKHAVRARDLISSVAGRGLFHGASVHTEPTVGLAFSPDGRQLASTARDGRVVIYDVETAATRVVAKLHGKLSRVQWRGNDEVLVNDGTGLWRIAVGSGTKQMIADRVHEWWLVDSERVRYLDDKRIVVEVMIRSSTRRELARDIEEITILGPTAVLWGTQQVSLLDGDRQRVLDVDSAMPRFAAISLDRKRIAVLRWNRVLEWDVETLAQTTTWSLMNPTMLAYSPHGLMSTRGTTLFYLRPDGTTGAVQLRQSPSALVGTPSAMLVAYHSGDISVVDDAGVRTLTHDHPGTRTVAVTGKLAAVGSLTGAVRWIDLTAVAPSPHQLGQHNLVCPSRRGEAFVFAHDGVLHIDLASGARRPLFELPVFLSPTFSCWGADDAIVATQSATFNVFDLKTRTGVAFAAAAMIVERERVTFMRGREILEVATTSGARERVVWTSPSELLALASKGRWVVALHAHAFTIFDRETGETRASPAAANVEAFGVDADGRVWYAADRLLRVGHRVFELPGKIERAVLFEDRWFVQLESGAVWEVGEVTIERFPSGTPHLVFGARDMAIARDLDSVVTYYLSSGETMTRKVPNTDLLTFSNEGDTFFARYAGGILVFDDPVPRGFPEALAWLARATNARLDPETRAIDWK